MFGSVWSCQQQPAFRVLRVQNSMSLAMYDGRAFTDDDSDGEHVPEPGLSASFPEEASPLRNGTVRPTIARQRSSSTQLSRPKLPGWPHDGSIRSRAHVAIDDDAADANWDRSNSGSPPPRLSLEGYSSRSSSSPAQQSSTATSPDQPELVGRKSFKRSITVPTRPRIPGTWGTSTEENTTMPNNDVSVRASLSHPLSS